MDTPKIPDTAPNTGGRGILNHPILEVVDTVANRRNQATPVPPSNGGEWEDVRVGLGEEWNFEDGPLVGDFLGSVERALEDKRTGEQRNQLVHQFAPESDPETIVFLWGSYQLDAAFEKVDAGTRCRVQYQGTRNISGADGPRVVKQYRVQVARS